MGKWITMAVVLFIVAVGLPIGYATYTVREYARHACQALDVLTSERITKPADPKATPAREQLYELYQGLVYWSRADGCR